MQDIAASRVTPRLRALFDAAGPAALRCYALLDGKTAGRIVSDDPVNPVWAAAWEGYEDGTTFLGGRFDAVTLAKVIDRLRETGDVLIGFWPGDPIAMNLPGQPDYDGRVLEWLGRDLAIGLERYLTQKPADMELRLVDEALLGRTAWGQGIIVQFGSVEGYLRHGLGYCLMNGETIVCEVWVGPISGGLREISVETHEPHRGRGYGAITCAHAIRECESAGYQTYWNTAKQNTASAALARKLGYSRPREYRLLAWSRRPSH